MIALISENPVLTTIVLIFAMCVVHDVLVCYFDNKGGKK